MREKAENAKETVKGGHQREKRLVEKGEEKILNENSYSL